MFVVAKGAKTFQVGHFHVKLTGVHNKLIDNYMRKNSPKLLIRYNYDYT